MPLLYCQNNVTRAGEFANCDVSRALLPPIYYRWRATGTSVAPEGNEGKWFRANEVQRRETRDAKSLPDAAQKNSIRAGKSAPVNAYLYRGFFFRVRVVPA